MLHRVMPHTARVTQRSTGHQLDRSTSLHAGSTSWTNPVTSIAHGRFIIWPKSNNIKRNKHSRLCSDTTTSAAIPTSNAPTKPSSSSNYVAHSNCIEESLPKKDYQHLLDEVRKIWLSGYLLPRNLTMKQGRNARCNFIHRRHNGLCCQSGSQC